MDDPRWIAACAEFESLGESTVRAAVTGGDWKSVPPKHAFAIEWCRLKDEARAAASSAKRDAREEETLSIAREAMRAVRKDRYIAIAAITIAAIAAHKEIIWLVSSVIS